MCNVAVLVQNPQLVSDRSERIFVNSFLLTVWFVCVLGALYGVFRLVRWLI
jgi:hypothetical protein